MKIVDFSTGYDVASGGEEFKGPVGEEGPRRSPRRRRQDEFHAPFEVAAHAVREGRKFDGDVDFTTDEAVAVPESEDPTPFDLDLVR